jgi:hypothetical protein
MNRQIESKWIWIGIIVGIFPLLGLAHPPSLSIEVLSIFFGALFAIVSILPSTSGYEKMKEISRTGHLKSLIIYILFPLWCSFILLLIKIFSSSIDFQIPQQIPSWIPQGIVMAIWGIFLLSLIRVLILLPLFLSDYKDNE